MALSNEILAKLYRSDSMLDGAIDCKGCDGHC